MPYHLGGGDRTTFERPARAALLCIGFRSAARAIYFSDSSDREQDGMGARVGPRSS
jgi:hypothetical protein